MSMSKRLYEQFYQQFIKENGEQNIDPEKLELYIELQYEEYLDRWQEEDYYEDREEHLPEYDYPN